MGTAFVERRTFPLTYQGLHDGGNCMIFAREGKELRLPISQLIISKDGRPANELKRGDDVMVMLPVWLARKVGLEAQAPNRGRYNTRRKYRRASR